MELAQFDRRWLFLMLGLVAVIFLRVPIPQKVTISEPVRTFYEAIESIPSGAKVHLAIDYGPGSQAELLPMHRAVVYHLLRKDVKIIASSLWLEGPPLTEQVFEEIVEELKAKGKEKVYSRDFVNLGFKAGQDVVMAKLGTSFPETYPKDSRGTPVSELEIMQGVTNYSDLAILISIATGSPGTRQWLQQVQQRYKVRMVAGVTAVMTPDLYAFYQSEQLEGFLGGLVGAAEYEKLVNRPGQGLGGMSVQSVSHFLIIGFIIFGNFIYLRERRKKKSTGTIG